MKKLPFLLAFLCLTSILFAQQTLVSFEPIAKKPRISALLTNANQSGTIGISYAFNGKLYWNAIDKKGQVLEKMTLSLGAVRTKPEGAISTDTHFYHFYKDSDNQSIKIICAAANGKNGKILQKELLAKKERFIGAIADKNTFFLLALNKKAKVLTIFKFNTQTESFDKTTIPIKDALVDKFHKVNFRAVKAKDLMSPYQAASLLKLYVLKENQLLLSIDGEKARGHGTTELITLNLTEATTNTKILGKSALAVEGHTKSLVLDQHIYRITATKELLNVSIYNLTDYTLKKEYEYTKEETIGILDSPFFSESESNNGFYLFNPARKGKIEQPETKKLLKKLAVGSPFIIATAFDDQQTLLTIGTYIIKNAGGGYFMPGMPGGSINTPNGPVAMPGTPGAWVGGTSNSYKQSRFFYSLVHTDDFTHVEGTADVKKSVHPVHKFVNNTLTNKHICSVLPYGEKTAVVHYMRSEKQITVTLIE